MIKFDEQKQLDSTAGALAIRKEIERIAEAVEKVKALGTVVIGFVDKAVRRWKRSATTPSAIPRTSS